MIFYCILFAFWIYLTIVRNVCTGKNTLLQASSIEYHHKVQKKYYTVYLRLDELVKVFFYFFFKWFNQCSSFVIVI